MSKEPREPPTTRGRWDGATPTPAPSVEGAVVLARAQLYLIAPLLVAGAGAASALGWGLWSEPLSTPGFASHLWSAVLVIMVWAARPIAWAFSAGRRIFVGTDTHLVVLKHGRPETWVAWADLDSCLVESTTEMASAD